MHIKQLHFQYLRNLSNRIDDQTIKTESLADKNSGSPQFGDQLEFNKINVFCGINGSGKSTVLDAFRSLTHNQLLVSMGRELHKDNFRPAWRIDFDNDDAILIELPYTSQTAKEQKKATQKIKVSQRTRKELGTLEGNFKKHVADNKLKNFLGGNYSFIKYWSPEEITKKQPKNLDIAIEFFNKNNDYFTGVTTNPSLLDRSDKTIYLLPSALQRKENDIVSLRCSDDPSVLNNLQYQHLPHGWRAIFSLLTFLKSLKHGEIALIEEPEAYLHPRLQRLLISEISSIAEVKNIQFFLTSHSPVIINSFTGNTFSLFHTQGHNVTNVPNISEEILNELGGMASDLMQSNGIVWVEGPSDIIYIKAWLSAYAKSANKPELKYSLDMQFSMYGGVLLYHVGTEDELVNALEINRNAIFIMDRDLDLKNGVLSSDTKKRIIEQFNNNDNRYAWLTEQYTVENYLDESFRKEYFTEDKKGRLKLKKGRKVDIARKYAINDELILTSLKNNPTLNKHIEKMYKTIASWNQV